MFDSNQTTHQSAIAKYVQPDPTGIRPYEISRYAIGYVMRGRKYIYDGDRRLELNRGDMFFMNIGCHYIEDTPMDGKPFEQIVFFYTCNELRHILSILDNDYRLRIVNNHVCTNCYRRDFVSYPAWPTAKNFFGGINQYLNEEVFAGEPAAEMLKATELIYLIVTNDECCLKNKVLNEMALAPENMEQIVQKHIFDNIELKELAALCNQSVTSFKREFMAQFHDTPHRWFMKRRMSHARLMLTSTNKTVATISAECGFTNTSHFIKLFKNEYGSTPVAYRTAARLQVPGQEEAEEPETVLEGTV